MKSQIRMWWSWEDECWVAVDDARPGCSAVHTNKTKLRREIRHAQDAWDEARSNLCKAT